MNPWLEFIRKNAETRWPDEIRDLMEPALARLRLKPSELSSFPFSLLFSAVIAWGPKKIEPVATQLAPLVRPGLESRAPRDNKSIADLDVLDLANFMACCGYSDETQIADEWLSEVRTYRDDEDVSPHWNKAFAALALGRKGLYRAMAGVDPTESVTLSRDRRFGGNVQGLLRHLAAAVEQGSGAAAVEVGWRDFLDMLVAHDDARSIDLATPFWVARIVHHQIGGSPLGSVAQWLHDELER